MTVNPSHMKIYFLTLVSISMTVHPSHMKIFFLTLVRISMTASITHDNLFSYLGEHFNDCASITHDNLFSYLSEYFNDCASHTPNIGSSAISLASDYFWRHPIRSSSETPHVCPIVTPDCLNEDFTHSFFDFLKQCNTTYSVFE